MVLIPTPLELLRAITSWDNDSSPVIGARTSTSATVEFGTYGTNEVLSTVSLVFGL